MVNVISSDGILLTGFDVEVVDGELNALGVCCLYESPNEGAANVNVSSVIIADEDCVMHEVEAAITNCWIIFRLVLTPSVVSSLSDSNCAIESKFSDWTPRGLLFDGGETHPRFNWNDAVAVKHPISSD